MDNQQDNGVSAAQTGPSQAEPVVSALRASVPDAARVDVEARRVATLVADRCHGDRPAGAAPTRYAMIWQAARMGVIECLLPSTGVPCELCQKPVRLGHYVNIYDDIGEAHADCAAPHEMPTQSTPAPNDDGSIMDLFILTGNPLALEPRTQPNPPSSIGREE